MAAEKNFENKIKKFLDQQGCWYVKYFANRMTKSGIPDILACVNGYFVGIEVKASNGKPSELQIYHRGKIREAGGISVIVYPEQFEEFARLIIMLNHGFRIAAFEDQLKFDKE
ncbi:VRR-NUC domain-containing protein [Priestia megaterium]|uniref:VRR-NUC domain-containing protein n=1 Tax=Priestia megaterium TaxID=1404 RepID=UPI00399C6128